MVTLLGFFFILGNVGLLIIFMPDLVGPVRATPPFSCFHPLWTHLASGDTKTDL